MSMLLDNLGLYRQVWDRVGRELKFRPDCRDRSHSFRGQLPFALEGSFSVYGIEEMREEHIDRMDRIIGGIFLAVTREGERLYALDWQHSAFLYDPRKAEEQKDIPGKGGYTAFFPSFYPDGDYHFFIDEHFRFGYLGHPWRQEVWIFGEELVKQFEEKYKELGWVKWK